MLIKTQGIIFRAIKYSETSIITDIYTQTKGLRTYIISGVRSKKSKVSASLLQLMSLVDIVAYHREDKDISRLKEIRPAVVYRSIPFDVFKGTVGLFMIEVAQKSIREQEENEPLFHYIFDSFCFLDESQQSISNLHLHFMLHLTIYLGFRPAGVYDEKTPYFDLEEGYFTSPNLPHSNYLEAEQSRLLFELLEIDRNHAHTVKMTRNQRNQLLENLLLFYQLHIENFSTINSYAVLKEVLE